MSRKRWAPRPIALGVAVLAIFVACVVCADRARAGAEAKHGGVRFVYLIRHGSYHRQADQDDVTGNGLDPLGHQQAHWTGKRLATLPVKISSLVSSDFTRARETADDIGQEVGVTPVRDPLLHECSPPSGPAPDAAHPDSPEARQCAADLTAAFAKYFRPSPGADARDVLVCHGNVIRWLVGHALGLDPRTWTRMDIANGGITVIAVYPDGVTQLVTYSDTGHIPPASQTWLDVGPGWSPTAP